MGLEQSSSTSPHQVELLGAPQGEARPSNSTATATAYFPCCAFTQSSVLISQSSFLFPPGLTPSCDWQRKREIDYTDSHASTNFSRIRGDRGRRHRDLCPPALCTGERRACRYFC